jgi:uncharacterized protein DUF3606
MPPCVFDPNLTIFTELNMPDDKSKRGASDRRRVAGGEPYEVGYFARKHGISRDKAESIIKRTRGNREKANAEAEKVAARR